MGVNCFLGLSKFKVINENVDERALIADILDDQDSRFNLVSSADFKLSQSIDTDGNVNVIDHRLVLTFNQFIELGDAYSGEVILQDDGTGLVAAFSRFEGGLDERISDVRFDPAAPKEIDLTSARQLRFLPDNFEGIVRLNDTAANIRAEFGPQDEPLFLPSSVELVLSVEHLDAFTGDYTTSDDSKLTGTGALTIKGLDVESAYRYPKVLRNLPDSFNSIDLVVEAQGATLDIGGWLPTGSNFLNLKSQETQFALSDVIPNGYAANWSDYDNEMEDFFSTEILNLPDELKVIFNGFRIADGGGDLFDGGNFISTYVDKTNSVGELNGNSVADINDFVVSQWEDAGGYEDSGLAEIVSLFPSLPLPYNTEDINRLFPSGLSMNSEDAKDMASMLYFGHGSNYEVFNGTEYFMLAVEDSQAESFKVTGYTGIFKENEHNDDITVDSGAFGLSGFSVFYRQISGSESDASQTQLFIVDSSDGIAADISDGLYLDTDFSHEFPGMSPEGPFGNPTVTSFDNPNFNNFAIENLPSNSNFLYSVIAGEVGSSLSEDNLIQIAGEMIGRARNTTSEDSDSTVGFLGTLTAAARRNAIDINGNKIFEADKITINAGESVKVPSLAFYQNGLHKLVEGNGELTLTDYTSEDVSELPHDLFVELQVSSGSETAPQLIDKSLVCDVLTNEDGSPVLLDGQEVITGADKITFASDGFYRMTAVDAYELQNLINKVKSGPVLVPQNATLSIDDSQVKTL